MKNEYIRLVRTAARRLGVSAGVICLTLASGIDWARAADAAGTATDAAVQGGLPVVLLLLIMLARMAAAARKPPQRVKVKRRAGVRRARRR